MMAGVTYVKAPDIHVLIKLSEEMATSDTPAVPGTPAFTPKPEEKKSSQKSSERGPAAQAPGWGPANNASFGLGNRGGVVDMPPVLVPPPPSQPSSPPPTDGWVPGIAAVGKPAAWPPLLDTSGTRTQEGVIARPIPIPDVPVIPSGPWGPVRNPANGQARGPARVPSCVLVGKKLESLALYDLNRKPWEFPNQRRGKLVLLDFWGTMCVPCRETIPHLRILQTQYGRAGLEVIGIAYESGGTFEEQARRVQSVAARLQTNYLLLMGGGSQCPVRTQFNVRAIPTLVLLDENGWIVYRHEGLLDRYHLEELELIIRRRLGL
jgi:thiol-disulfide isomerase/thioredoxin